MTTTEEIKSLIEFRLNQAEQLYGKPVKYLIIELLALHKTMFEQENTRYIGVAEWNLYHTYPTISGLRNLINKAKQNGFEKYNVVHRQNGHVFINEQNYFRWFKEYKRDQQNKYTEKYI